MTTNTKSRSKHPAFPTVLWPCFTCQGTGGARGKCTDCDGAGWVK